MSRYGKRILAAGMCATMTMGLLTGCSSSTGKTVAKMGDAKITLGEAEFMLRYNQAKTQGYLGALFGEGSNVFQQDLTGSGQAYGVTMKESVMNDLKNMILMEDHMSDYNVELTDEEKAAIEETAKGFLAENSKDVLKALAATEETVTRVLTLYTIQSKMQTAIEADVDTEVSDDEAAQKSIQYVYFTIPETESEAEDTTEAESGSEEDTTEAATDTAEKSGETVAETESETDLRQKQPAKQRPKQKKQAKQFPKMVQRTPAKPFLRMIPRKQQKLRQKKARKRKRQERLPRVSLMQYLAEKHWKML